MIPILQQLGALIAVNLRYAWRNMVLIALILVFSGVTALQLLPFLIGLMSTSTKKFDLVIMLYNQADLLLYLTIALLGLMSLSQELRNRSMKLIVTRPCRFETWLAGQYITAALITAVCHAALVAITSILFLVWGIENTPGLAVLGVYSFCQTLIVFAWILLLTSFLHPLIAAVIAFIVQEGFFWFLMNMTLSGVEQLRKAEISQKWLILGLEGLAQVFKAAYLLLPSFAPFQKEMAGFSGNLRLTPEVWSGFGGSLLYTAVLLVFTFAATSWILRGRRLT
jgi:hypothetical protein